MLVCWSDEEPSADSLTWSPDGVDSSFSCGRVYENCCWFVAEESEGSDEVGGNNLSARGEDEPHGEESCKWSESEGTVE